MHASSATSRLPALRAVGLTPLGLAMVLLAASAPAAPHEWFTVAITVDDLSGSGPAAPGITRLAVARSYLATLKRFHAPQVYGFVNARLLETQSDGAAVLDAWRAAGYLLGNHGYSHLNLNQAATLNAWTADVVAGEPEVAKRMRVADWHYLRLPNLVAGADQQRHDAAMAFLRARSYRIADVSLTFDDWSYSAAYVRCRERGDQAAIAQMKVRYLQAVDTGIARMRDLSSRVYGRTIPQVLLTHLSAWGAWTLPDVLARLRAAGARFVTLPQAQADPAYAHDDPRAGDQLLMERIARQRSVSLDGLPVLPRPADTDSICR